MTWLPQIISGPDGSFALGFKQHGLCACPSFLIMQNVLLNLYIWNKDFRPLINRALIFLLSPGKTLLTLTLVQEWLDTRNAAVVAMTWIYVRGGSWSTHSSLSLHFFWSSPIFLMSFAWQSFIPVAFISVCTFSYHTFPFHSTFYEYAWIHHPVNSQLAMNFWGLTSL